MIFAGDIAQPFKGASTVNIPEWLKKCCWLVNLEGSLIKETQGTGVYNNFDAVSSLLDQINIRAFNTANNHILDSADVDETIKNIRQLGKAFFGSGRNITEARKPLVFEDNDNSTYCILAFGWDNVQCKIASKKRQGVNPYSRQNIIDGVKTALLKHGNVVCFMHWDYELEAYPQPYDRKLAHDLIDMGVVAVVGCHAHRTQPIEFYKGKPIIYGLGNFLFYQGYYFNGQLSFPKLCEEEYAFELINDGKIYKIHYFIYNQTENMLEYRKCVELTPDGVFNGKAEFSGMNDSEYEKWFKCNRIQRKLLPIFHSEETAFCYLFKSIWVKVRGSILDFLRVVNLKSANRAK